MKNLHNILLSIIVILLIVIIYCMCNNKKSETVTSLSAGQGKSRTSCNWDCYRYNDQCQSTPRSDGLCDWTYIRREPRPQPGPQPRPMP